MYHIICLRWMSAYFHHKLTIKFHHDSIMMILKTSEMKIQIEWRKLNLPIVFDSFVLASSMHSGLECHTLLNVIDFIPDNNLQDLSIVHP